MGVFGLEYGCGNGSCAIAAGSTGTVRSVSSASKNSWAFNTALALVRIRSGSVKSITS